MDFLHANGKIPQEFCVRVQADGDFLPEKGAGWHAAGELQAEIGAGTNGNATIIAALSPAAVRNVSSLPICPDGFRASGGWQDSSNVSLAGPPALFSKIACTAERV